jgi:membrane protease subunit HflK
LASGDEKLDTDQKIRRGVLRTLSNGMLVLICLAVIGGWASTGFYYLQLGESAVILRVGEYHRTVTREGWLWHWPEPLEYETVINTEGVRTQVFGSKDSESTQRHHEEGDSLTDEFVNFIQTADSNIVNVSYEIQYTILDAFSYRYGMAEPEEILFEVTESSVRQIIGGKSVDEVLYRNRYEIEVEAQRLLEQTLASYFSREGREPPFSIDKLNLQTVQPPAAVRPAFEDVVAAQQDENRSLLLATGDSREIIERSHAEAAELHERSAAYRETKVLESRGEAARFTALLAEYQRAPEVTRERLYLEAMEDVLPNVEKMVVDPNTASVVPLLSIPRGRIAPPRAPGEGEGQ